MKIMDETNREKRSCAAIDKDWVHVLEKLQHYASSYVQAQIDLNGKGVSVDVQFGGGFEEGAAEKEGSFSQPEVECLMTEHPDTFDDYLEMVKQVCFSFTW